MWYLLGMALVPHETVTVCGRSYNQRECYIKAVELDPSLSSIWCALGRGLFEPVRDAHTYQNMSVSVIIGGISFTAKECYIRSLELDPLQGTMSWCNLGFILGNEPEVGGASCTSSSSIIVVNGSSYNARQCLLKAVQTDPLNSTAWYHFGNDLCKHKQTAFINGKSYTGKECYRHALDVDPQHKVTLHSMATSMQQLASSLANFASPNFNNTTLTSDPIKSDTWLRLGKELTGCEHVVVYGGRHFKKECFVNATLMDPTRLDVWWALAKCLSPNETAIVNSMVVHAHLCYSMGLVAEPRRGDAWLEIGQLLAKGQTFICGGRAFSKEQCLKIAKDLLTTKT